MVDASPLIVEFQPIGRRTEILPGQSILEAARLAGVGLISLCGGEGWCQSCVVRIINGEVTQPADAEIDYLGNDKIDEGFRLACKAVPQTDVRIDIPPIPSPLPSGCRLKAGNLRSR